jgi:hypothetical protein
VWGAYARIDHLGCAFQQVLWVAGCRFLFFGIGDAAARLLNLIGKHFDPDIVLPRIAALQQARLPSLAAVETHPHRSTRRLDEAGNVRATYIIWSAFTVPSSVFPSGNVNRNGRHIPPYQQ